MILVRVCHQLHAIRYGIIALIWSTVFKLNKPNLKECLKGVCVLIFPSKLVAEMTRRTLSLESGWSRDQRYHQMTVGTVQDQMEGLLDTLEALMKDLLRFVRWLQSRSES